jgi:oligosaccharyltransferase complex subunit beta
MVRLSCVLLLGVVAAACCLLSTHAVSNTQHETDVPTPPAQPRTLALIQSRQLLQSHSGFFRLLKQRGHQLTFAVAGEDPVKLNKFDTLNYDHLLIMAPSAEDLGEGMSAEAVSQFVDQGRSVLIMGGSSVGEPLREMAAELGIDIDEDGTAVQDHGSFAEDDSEALQGGQHDLVKGALSGRATNFVGQPKGPILFRGIGHSAQPSQQFTPLLTGSATAFSAELGSMLEEYPAAAGRDVLLVSALQTRGNARVVFSGSIDLFSNELLYRQDASGASTGNEAFVRELAAWTFNQRGVLRARKLTHFKVGAEHDINPGSYRVQDNIVS